ncbi:MAG: glutathione synthase/RimK-type ligase-like ATP-grasp enzyme [Flavobacteriales bacterium]|jgi:glutathione synthase/RimK-type ligase-like ATP-grasp enzyme
MKTFDIVLVTANRFIDPNTSDWYSNQAIQEDQLLLDSCARQGLRATRIEWTSKTFDWSSTKCLVIRAIWDYHMRFDEFKSWLLRANKSTLLFNPVEAVGWNLDKIYLREMQSQGINIPQTIFFDKNDSKNVASLALSLNWEKFIIKPRVSAGGRETHLFNRDEIELKSEFINSLFSEEDMMIQEFQNNIVSQGEMSSIMFGEQYSHSIIKSAAAGDFRVQDNFGGSVGEYIPSQKEIEFAKTCIEACPFDTSYARVDYFIDNQGELALGELEIIEPELWFRECDTAADSLVTMIKGKIA